MANGCLTGAGRKDLGRWRGASAARGPTPPLAPCRRDGGTWTMPPTRRYCQERNSGLEAADPLVTRFTGRTEERASLSVNSGTRDKGVADRRLTCPGGTGGQSLPSLAATPERHAGVFRTGPRRSEHRENSSSRPTLRRRMSPHSGHCRGPRSLSTRSSVPTLFPPAFPRLCGVLSDGTRPRWPTDGHVTYFFILEIKRGEGTGYVLSPPCRRVCRGELDQAAHVWSSRSRAHKLRPASGRSACSPTTGAR